MTLRSYANKRDANEPEIVEALRKAGCSVVRLDKPVDLLIGYRGVTHLAEVKTDKGKLTKAQDDFRKSWQGSYFYILRDVDDALTMLRIMQSLRKAA